MTRNTSAVLGVTAYHGDSAAALLVDGVLVAAAEEERFSRLKHTAAFPKQAIAFCLAHAGLKPEDVTVVATPGRLGSGIAARAVMSVKHPFAMFRKLQNRTQGIRPSLETVLAEQGLGRARLARFEHHLSHMASVLPLLEGQDGVLLTLDGLGDFTSAAWGGALKSKALIKDRVHFPHSLGFLYTALTHHLGFKKFGEEFKVMGLSSFGKPVFAERVRLLVETRPGFSFQLNERAFPLARRGVPFRVEADQPVIGCLHDETTVTKVLGVPARRPEEPLASVHADIAASLQAVFEEIADHLLHAALRQASHGSVVGLAGGCAHNSVWVGKIKDRHRVEQVHVAPASHDAGLAIGAAVLAADTPVTCSERHWALLGPAFDAPGPGIAGGESFSDDASLQAWLADVLAGGSIVGLFRGRLEFGPRALGSRSILCDPRQAAMRDRLNARVKHREPFRPFAAIVLAERQHEWFVGSFRAPTMEAVFPVRESVKEKIGAVVHADGSCRIQTVEKDVQPFLWGLLAAFEARTGVPMLVNTSFNDSEPIVCTPQDAMNCFRRTEMDYLVIGRTVFRRDASLKAG